jgi:hypothetical protein
VPQCQAVNVPALATSSGQVKRNGSRCCQAVGRRSARPGGRGRHLVRSCWGHQCHAAKWSTCRRWPPAQVRRSGSRCCEAAGRRSARPSGRGRAPGALTLVASVPRCQVVNVPALATSSGQAQRVEVRPGWAGATPGQAVKAVHLVRSRWGHQCHGARRSTCRRWPAAQARQCASGRGAARLQAGAAPSHAVEAGTWCAHAGQNIGHWAGIGP